MFVLGVLKEEDEQMELQHRLGITVACDITKGCFFFVFFYNLLSLKKDWGAADVGEGVEGPPSQGI